LGKKKKAQATERSIDSQKRDNNDRLSGNLEEKDRTSCDPPKKRKKEKGIKSKGSWGLRGGLEECRLLYDLRREV